MCSDDERIVESFSPLSHLIQDVGETISCVVRVSLISLHFDTINRSLGRIILELIEFAASCAFTEEDHEARVAQAFAVDDALADAVEVVPQIIGETCATRTSRPWHEHQDGLLVHAIDIESFVATTHQTEQERAHH